MCNLTEKWPIYKLSQKKLPTVRCSPYGKRDFHTVAAEPAYYPPMQPIRHQSRAKAIEFRTFFQQN
jgi:hypothetical protein